MNKKKKPFANQKERAFGICSNIKRIERSSSLLSNMNGNNFFLMKNTNKFEEMSKKSDNNCCVVWIFGSFLVRKSALENCVCTKTGKAVKSPWQSKAQNRHLEPAEMTSSFLKDFGAKHTFLVPAVVPAWVLSPWWARLIWGSHNMGKFCSALRF